MGRGSAPVARRAAGCQACATLCACRCHGDAEACIRAGTSEHEGEREREAAPSKPVHAVEQDLSLSRSGVSVRGMWGMYAYPYSTRALISMTPKDRKN